MENMLKNFVNGITGADNRRKSLIAQSSSSSVAASAASSSSSSSTSISLPREVPRADKQTERNFSGNSNRYLSKMETTRNRTESESSNASMSSMSSIGSQKDKDSYFWVMWHS
ncbi:uncharacterized protein LOC129573659 [Sitodiplosis mosellana]|uniref:uncharacterized protein LOC129573659 n=1 Tax=Sitodiplosis mosellana TaxID=263140 RepID=UPI002443906E|nr:uncharacterized protein LOC129573659 [Sitodiplosis mosellana]